MHATIQEVARATGLTSRTLRHYDVEALAQHVDLMRDERDRLDRRIRSVQRTVESLRQGEPLMTTTAFDGFDHPASQDAQRLVARHRAWVAGGWNGAAPTTRM